MIPSLTTPEEVDSYRSRGWVILKGFYDPQRDFNSFFSEVHQLLNYLNVDYCPNHHGPDPTGSLMAERMLVLQRQDRDALSAVYRNLRHLLSLQHLLLDQRLQSVYRQLEPQIGMINLCPYTGTRIDIKGEEEYLFGWHQDYHYIQMSEDSVVFWFPFVELDSEGAVEILERSHLDGVRRATLLDPENRNRNGAKTLSIDNDVAVERYARAKPKVSVGDVLVFSTLTVHRSIPQRTKPIRVTSQFRLGNFANSSAIKRRWPVGQLEGRFFHDDHRDLVDWGTNKG